MLPYYRSFEDEVDLKDPRNSSIIPKEKEKKDLGYNLVALGNKQKVVNKGGRLEIEVETQSRLAYIVPALTRL